MNLIIYLIAQFVLHIPGITYADIASLNAWRKLAARKSHSLFTACASLSRLAIDFNDVLDEYDDEPTGVNLDVIATTYYADMLKVSSDINGEFAGLDDAQRILSLLSAFSGVPNDANLFKRMTAQIFHNWFTNLQGVLGDLQASYKDFLEILDRRLKFILASKTNK